MCSNARIFFHRRLHSKKKHTSDRAILPEHSPRIFGFLTYICEDCERVNWPNRTRSSAGAWTIFTAACRGPDFGCLRKTASANDQEYAQWQIWYRWKGNFSEIIAFTEHSEICRVRYLKLGKKTCPWKKTAVLATILNGSKRSATLL